MQFQSTRPIRGATAKDADSTADKQFQSTRPIRGATPERCDHGYHPGISIHAPHTGRDVFQVHAVLHHVAISIHAPHTGRDDPSSSSGALANTFQSTRPIRGATGGVVGGQALRAISIHAPHTGRDILLPWPATGPIDFNPRAPYGARRPLPATMSGIPIFQSTRPIRGATCAGLS